MADIGIAGSSTDINGLPQTPHCKLPYTNWNTHVHTLYTAKGD